MRDYIYIIGLDPPEYQAIRERVDVPVVANEVLPGIIVQDGTLFGEVNGRLLPVSKVVYHGIFEDDLNFITGLALWGGPCLPSARAMMDCRLKFPCLVKALEHTRFGGQRGFASPYMRVHTETELVAKWGNWHCGENKDRFTGSWTAQEYSIIEPFHEGQAVRVVIIGNQHWQIRLQGNDWLKSIHHANADFMDVDPELLDDTRRLQQAFGLEIIANDYMVSPDGSRHLLEVNHIPNVTRFPELWQAYLEFVVNWIQNEQGRDRIP